MAIFLIVFLIACFFINSIFKKRSRARLAKEKADAIRNTPPADKLSLAKMYFGKDWDTFYQDLKPGRRFSDTFYNIIAFSLTKLAPSDLAAVIIQFGFQSSQNLIFQKTAEMIDVKTFYGRQHGKPLSTDHTPEKTRKHPSHSNNKYKCKN